MSYHVLARKWRPQTFTDLVGQAHVVKALTYALSHQQIHHAYLFTGTRGVGKTSIARIFAKSLNCEKNGISANPCGECETCEEIKSGKFVDLIEVDAASRTGVEETRELIESVAYLPSKGRYKVYLIDEVHMFSKSSFNALLKTLEEPPEHVKFILATTDPEKLPITILSRCLQFNLKSLTPPQIRQHLVNICEAESIKYDDEALALLANAGDGSMRDTLSMTDQAIAYGHGELRLSAVTEILGTIQPTDIEAILFAIATNNPNQLNQALHRLDEYEVDARAFLIEIMRRLQRMAWAKEGINDNLSPALQSTVNDIPKALLHLWYDIAEKALANLAIAGEPRQAVEMALLRMLAFIPDDWVVRHRTLLDTHETEAPTAPIPMDSPIAHQQAPTMAEAHAPSPAFAPVQATPVIEHDSLDSAEAEFSGEPLPKPEQQTAPPNEAKRPIPTTPKPEKQLSPIELISALTAPETREEQAPTQQESPSVPTQTAETIHENIIETPNASSSASDNWRLGQADANEPAPSMDDIRSMMQSGRDINAPEKSQEGTYNDIPSNDNSGYDDLPPWEEKTPFSDVQILNKAHSIAQQNAPEESENPLNAIPLAVSHTKAPSAANETTPEAVITPIDINDFDWHNTLANLHLSGYTHHLASLGILRLKSADGHVQATLDLSPKHELLITDESLNELGQALEKGLSTPTIMQVHLTTIDQITPQEREKQNTDKQKNDLQTTFRQEPITQQILGTLEGQVLAGTVKPR